MSQVNSNTEALLEKWDGVLNSDKVDAIGDSYKEKVTAQLLENTEQFLAEASNVTAGVQNWDPVLISMVRRMAPKLIAYDILGVQPMTAPSGLLFCLKATQAGTPPNTNPQGGAEILGLQEAPTNYSGTGTHGSITAATFLTGFDTGTGMSTSVGETSA